METYYCVSFRVRGDICLRQYRSLAEREAVVGLLNDFGYSWAASRIENGRLINEAKSKPRYHNYDHNRNARSSARDNEQVQAETKAE